MKFIKKMTVLCLVVLFSSGTFSRNALADEANGGQVSRTSGITFLKGDDVPAAKPKPNVKPKPKPGVLPQTGEATQHYSLTGFLIVSLTMVMFFKLRRREYEK